ncbi:hypothetical protein NHQ30_002182 [Ciborinia camelliae]|nr:hypothetical protein NHQ30_002182 [Ciborinia camelliae]
MSPNINNNTHVRRNSVVGRGNFLCPEVLGAFPMACNSSRCGGEDPINNGTCYYDQGDGPKCQCIANATSTPTPTLTTITATQVGQASNQNVTQIITATFALESIPLYSDLRQNITSTILTNVTTTILTSITATLTDTVSVGVSATEETSVETAVAVILAGGAFWSLFGTKFKMLTFFRTSINFIIGFVGDAGVVATMDPPIDAPNHADDTTCPESRQICSSPNCAGILSMCANTNDPTRGCACDENPTCEETEIDCEDPTCSGKFVQLAQKGVANALLRVQRMNSLYYVMNAEEAAIDVSVFGPYVPFGTSAPDFGLAFSDLPTITDSSYWSPPRSAACPYSGWTATQYDDTHGPSANSSFRDWCGRMDGKTLGKTDSNDTVFQMYHFAYYSYWLSAQYWYSSPGEDKCNDTAVISKDECITAFSTGMSSCDPNSGDTHGFSYPGMCINYNVSISTFTNPQYPPWDPLPPSNEPGCNGGFSGVDSNFFKGIYPQFCSAFTSNQPANFSKRLTNADFKAPSKKRETRFGSLFTPRTPPGSSNEYQDYKLTFRWSGSSGGECRVDCKEAFEEIAQSNCKFTIHLQNKCKVLINHQGSRTGGEQNGMDYMASVSVGCGVYEYEITPPNPVPATCNPDDSLVQGDKQSASPSAMYAAADQFCNWGYNWTSIPNPNNYFLATASDYFFINDRCIDPRTSQACVCDGPGNDVAQMSPTFLASHRLCAKYPPPRPHSSFNSNNRVRLAVIPSIDQTGCEPLQPYVLPYGSECTNKFGYVTSACSIDAYPNGWGGFYTEKSKYGCYNWIIHGMPNP